MHSVSDGPGLRGRLAPVRARRCFAWPSERLHAGLWRKRANVVSVSAYTPGRLSALANVASIRLTLRESQRDHPLAWVHHQPTSASVESETKLLPVMGEAPRKRRHGTGRNSGQSWYADETYWPSVLFVSAIDRDGNLSTPC